MTPLREAVRQARLSLACRRFLFEDDSCTDTKNLFCTCKPSKVCRVVLQLSDCSCDRPPASCRLLIDLFRGHHESEHVPGINPLDSFARRVEKARDAGWHSVYLEGCCLLSKLHRVLSFDVISSRRCARQGIEYAERLLGQLKNLEHDLRVHLMRVVPDLREAEVWALIHARQFDAAEERMGRLFEDAPLATLRMAPSFIAFIKAHDGGRDFSEAIGLLEADAHAYRQYDQESLADHLDLYRGFAFALNEPPAFDRARELFTRLHDSPYLPARLFSLLGMSACDFLDGYDRESIRHSFERYQDALWQYQRRNNRRFRRYDVPWFLLLECRIAAFCEEGERRQIIDRLRKRVFTPLRNLESFDTLEGRLAYASLVRQFYETIVDLYAGAASLTGEEIVYLSGSIERSRRIAIMPWYAQGAFTAMSDGGEADYSSALPAFNPHGERPAEKLLAFTDDHTGSMVLFYTDSPRPVLTWFLDGIPGYTKYAVADEVTLLKKFAREHTGCLASAYFPRVYLFADDDLAFRDFDAVACLQELAGSRCPIEVYWCGDLIRFVRKLPLPPIMPNRWSSILTIHDTYPAQGANVLESGTARSLVRDHCQKSGRTHVEIDAATMRRKRELFDAIRHSDAVIIYAHGEAAEWVGSLKIQFSRFSVGLNDLYAFRDALEGKVVGLCSCSTGAPAAEVPGETIALGNVMVAAGTRLVYCPLAPIDQRTFTDRTKEFIDLLDETPVRVPKGWRVLV